jgi:acid phosphatase (class A)
MLNVGPKAKATYQLIRVGRRIGEIVVMCLKEHFQEARPSQVCPAITPMIDPPDTPSFPAGHALSARLMSLLLGAADRPATQTAMLDALSERVAENRTIAGLHYPLDNLAGFKAAEKVFAMLTNGADDRRCVRFLELIEAAKAEARPVPKKYYTP